MADQLPDVETARDLEELPTELRPLYRRLAHDGAAWRAASAGEVASLARTLAANSERMVSGSMTDASGPHTPATAASTGTPGGARRTRLAHPRKREWIAGTAAAVVVVTLLALVLQAALPGRGTTGLTNTKPGHWQALDSLTMKSVTPNKQAPVIAPSNPRVVYQATNSLSGPVGKAVTYASLRRTQDGGATWRNLTLPLPIAAVSTIQLQVSPFNARTVFMSIWDRTSIACEPTNGAVGEGCERGYVSYDSGDTWQEQKLPVRGVLDLDHPIAAQQNRMFASNMCNDNSCIHLLISADGGLSWQVVDDQLTTQGQHVCSFVATPNAGKLYAVTTRNTTASPQADCARDANTMTLWRSDDVGSQWGAADEGTHWTQLGPLLSIPSIGAQRDAPYAELLAAPSAGLVYLQVSQRTIDSAPLLYSEDYGVTWKSTPSLPTVAGSQPRSYPPGFPLQRISAAAMYDGTVVIAAIDGAAHTTLFIWKPGDAAWTRLPPLPATVSGAGTVIVVPGGSWRDTILVTLLQTSADGKVSYYAVRYQT